MKYTPTLVWELVDPFFEDVGDAHMQLLEPVVCIALVLDITCSVPMALSL